MEQKKMNFSNNLLTRNEMKRIKGGNIDVCDPECSDSSPCPNGRTCTAYICKAKVNSTYCANS